MPFTIRNNNKTIPTASNEHICLRLVPI